MLSWITTLTLFVSLGRHFRFFFLFFFSKMSRWLRHDVCWNTTRCFSLTPEICAPLVNNTCTDWSQMITMFKCQQQQINSSAISSLFTDRGKKNKICFLETEDQLVRSAAQYVSGLCAQSPQILKLFWIVVLPQTNCLLFRVDFRVCWPGNAGLPGCRAGERHQSGGLGK